MATVSQLGEALSWVLCTSHRHSQGLLDTLLYGRRCGEGWAIEGGASGTPGPR